MLSAEQIRQAADRPPQIERVSCAALGGEVGVRRLSCAELDRYQLQNVKIDSKGRVQQQGNARGRLLALVLCGEDGRPLFGEDDARVLGDLPAEWVRPALEKAKEINGLGEDAVEDAKGN